MSQEDYRSTMLIPLTPLRKFKKRAEHLRVSALHFARAILVLALDNGTLPAEPPEMDSEEEKLPFPFALDPDLVERLGGRERARELLRWAIVEGLDQSPLAAPEE